MAHLQFKLYNIFYNFNVDYCLLPLFNKPVKLHYNFIKKQKCDWKMEIVGQWKVSSVCTLRYLIINNPMSPDALYQDQSDKTQQEVKSNLISNINL